MTKTAGSIEIHERYGQLYREFGPPYFFMSRMRLGIGLRLTIGPQPFVVVRKVPREMVRTYWLSLLPRGEWRYCPDRELPYAYELVTD